MGAGGVRRWEQEGCGGGSRRGAEVGAGGVRMWEQEGCGDRSRRVKGGVRRWKQEGGKRMRGVVKCGAEE